MVKNYLAASLKEALEIREKENVVPYCGGTDLMIEPDKDAEYLFLHQVPEMRNIIEDDDYIRIGAACTFTEIIESKTAPKILKEASLQIAAPAIRNFGTIGGNIGNGSPKADSALIFFVTDSKLRLANSKRERILPIKEFYLGRKKIALQDDELIVEVLMPKTGMDNYYYKKVGARNAMAISRVCFAALLSVSDGKISHCATAFGAVSDVIIRRDDIDALLVGKTIEAAQKIKAEYLAKYEQAIVPIRGRVSAEYRKAVCLNLLNDFLTQNGI